MLFHSIRVYLLLIAMLYGLLLSAQDQKQVIDSIHIELKKGESKFIQLQYNYSSIYFENQLIGDALIDIRIDQKSYKLIAESNESEVSDALPSSFLFLKKGSRELELHAMNNLKLTVWMFDGLKTPAISPSVSKKTDPCEQPDAIDQSVWRDGLPDPKTGRIAVSVKHCIIHHSAGSNNLNDFTQAVRSIYLYHLQINGWDDIGYNYLIDPNGVIYKGRDPLELEEQDNTQGAHFCSKNSGTMGVCLIGDIQ